MILNNFLKIKNNKTRKFILEPGSVGENLYDEYKQLCHKVIRVTGIHDLMGYEESAKAMQPADYYYLPSDKVWACQTYRDGKALPRNVNDVSTDLYFM